MQSNDSLRSDELNHGLLAGGGGGGVGPGSNNANYQQQHQAQGQHSVQSPAASVMAHMQRNTAANALPPDVPDPSDHMACTAAHIKEILTDEAPAALPGSFEPGCVGKLGMWAKVLSIASQFVALISLISTLSYTAPPEEVQLWNSRHALSYQLIVVVLVISLVLVSVLATACGVFYVFSFHTCVKLLDRGYYLIFDNNGLMMPYVLSGFVFVISAVTSYFSWFMFHSWTALILVAVTCYNTIQNVLSLKNSNVYADVASIEQFIKIHSPGGDEVTDGALRPAGESLSTLKPFHLNAQACGPTTLRAHSDGKAKVILFTMIAAIAVFGLMIYSTFETAKKNDEIWDDVILPCVKLCVNPPWQTMASETTDSSHCTTCMQSCLDALKLQHELRFCSDYFRLNSLQNGGGSVGGCTPSSCPTAAPVTTSPSSPQQQQPWGPRHWI